MEWPEYNRRRRIVRPPPPSFRRYFTLDAETGNFLLCPLFQVCLACSALFQQGWNLGGSHGPQCAGKGSTWGEATWTKAEGGFQGWWWWGRLFIVPLELLSQTQSPLWGLMRTNWSECNKWITERDKRLYFVGCVCWDPPIICLLSWEHWLASAWSGSLNISLSLSCQVYYVYMACT